MTPQDWLIKDYYAVLGVPVDSNEAALKRAYRGLVRRHHPDVNGGSLRSERRFKEVGAAYAVLSDRRSRAQYDLVRCGSRPGAAFRTGATRRSRDGSPRYRHSRPADFGPDDYQPEADGPADPSATRTDRERPADTAPMGGAPRTDPGSAGPAMMGAWGVAVAPALWSATMWTAVWSTAWGQSADVWLSTGTTHRDPTP